VDFAACGRKVHNTLNRRAACGSEDSRRNETSVAVADT
jgi:hypothetical protein